MCRSHPRSFMPGITFKGCRIPSQFRRVREKTLPIAGFASRSTRVVGFTPSHPQRPQQRRYHLAQGRRQSHSFLAHPSQPEGMRHPVEVARAESIRVVSYFLSALRRHYHESPATKHARAPRMHSEWNWLSGIIRLRRWSSAGNVKRGHRKGGPPAVQNQLRRTFGEDPLDIGAILSRPPYSKNPTLNQPIIPAVTAPQ
jgi:hypothetical protein